MAAPPKERPEGFDPANDYESRASTVISIAVIFAALSSIFTGLRLYTRMKILRIFCSDDGAILLAQLISIASTVLTILETKHGLGRHTWVIDPVDSEKQIRLLYGVVLSYNLGLNVVKAVFLLLYIRIFESTALKAVSKWVLGYVLLWTLTQMIILVLACMPLAAIVPSMEGRCLPTYPVWLTSSVMSTVMDFVIFALPLPSVIRLKLRKKQKIVTVLMFSLGFFVCIVSIVRITTLKEAVSADDPTWDNVGPGSWSLVELNCAILCSNLPTLRPLAVRYFPTFGLSSGGATSGAYQRYSNSRSRDNTKSGAQGAESRTEGSRAMETGGSGRSDSTENLKAVATCFSGAGEGVGDEVELMEGKGGRILVTTEMAIRSDEARGEQPRRASYSWEERETGAGEVRQ